jgi:hypothetical protein
MSRTIHEPRSWRHRSVCTDEPLRSARRTASTDHLGPAFLRDLAIAAGRTTVLGCTTQMLFRVAVGVGGQLLVRAPAPHHEWGLTLVTHRAT